MDEYEELPPEPGTVQDMCLGIDLDVEADLEPPENDLELGDAEAAEGDDDGEA